MIFNALMHRLFSSDVPIEIRMQSGQPKGFRFLTMMPCFNKDLVTFEACDSESHTVVIKLATEGTHCMPSFVSSFLKNVYPV
jgi:hypothetical protein